MAGVQTVSNLVQNINVFITPKRLENSTDVDLGSSFGNEVEQTEVSSDKMAKLPELSSLTKCIMLSIPSVLLRDSTLAACQVTSTVPFIGLGNLHVFFSMGLGGKEHIEGLNGIINGKYDFGQKILAMNNKILLSLKMFLLS